MNKSLILLRKRVKDTNMSGSIPQIAMLICELLDDSNALHFHDRDRYHERITKLETESASLRDKIFRLETKGESA